MESLIVSSVWSRSGIELRGWWSSLPLRMCICVFCICDLHDLYISFIVGRVWSRIAGVVELSAVENGVGNQASAIKEAQGSLCRRSLSWTRIVAPSSPSTSSWSFSSRHHLKLLRQDFKLSDISNQQKLCLLNSRKIRFQYILVVIAWSLVQTRGKDGNKKWPEEWERTKWDTSPFWLI